MEDTFEPEYDETTAAEPVEADDVFITEEVVIEEMAIDGICGVY